MRTFTVLASALRGDASACEHERIAGVETLVARPRRGSGPVIVYANAMTPLGVELPAVGRFLAGAGAGFVAIAPELPQVRRGEVTPETTDALVRVARAAGPRVALVGASTGAGLAILAAGDPRLADRVTAVMAIAPFASLEHVLRLATTGFYGARAYATAPLVTKATVLSLAASAPGDQAVFALVVNRDPGRFDSLYGALEPRTRALVDELSPLTRMPHVVAPVEIVSAPNDSFFPVGEALALARSGYDVRPTVTRALDHVRPLLRPGLVGVAAALDRTLTRAAQAERAPALRPSLVPA